MCRCNQRDTEARASLRCLVICFGKFYKNFSCENSTFNIKWCKMFLMNTRNDSERTQFVDFGSRSNASPEPRAW